MNKSEIFVSDMDGTLLQTAGRLSDYSKKTLRQLLAAGVRFTVASARAWAEMTPILGDLPLRLPVIAVNGAYLTDYATGRHLVINHLDGAFAATIYAHILDEGLLPFVVTHNGQEDCLYWEKLINPEMQWYHDILELENDRRLRRIGKLTDALKEKVVAFAVMGSRENVTALAGLLAERYPQMMENFLFENPYHTGHWWLTLHDRKACKSKALRTLMELEGFSSEHLTVFGDHINDIKMFQLAGCAVAVANAEPIVKQHADQIIGPNDDDAVVNYIRDSALRTGDWDIHKGVVGQ
ncbi:MAG TPA: HAD family phosphatase [Phycisphaerales bacterium]|nr:HAD family phosphatase [Phycisphaerales bacterium]